MPFSIRNSRLRRFLKIRVIIERRLKKGEHISSLLRQLRVAAIAQRGYISGETLVNTEDSNFITVISTWRSIEDWRAWEKSEQRTKSNRQIASLLEGPSIIKVYSIMSTEESEYLENPTDWLQKKERPSFDG
ncbi:antibiotic biosynthesis monooxygenase family protein [Chloroflexota bacterium]